MRTIKFRGKRKDNGEWIFGHLCDYMRGQSFCIMPDSYFATTDFGEEDDNGDVVLQTGMAIGEWFTVIPETIGQFTGLLDKNGKEIYDGDIIKAPHDFGPGGFADRIFCVHFHLQLGYQWNYWLMDKAELIGNKHDNPELLK